MKRKKGNYLQLSRKLFNNEEFQKLSNNAKWLYVVLNELEHQYSGKTEDYFYRSNALLAEDTGMSLATLKRAKEELRPLVDMWRMHFIEDTKTGKKSERAVTAYRIKE